MSTQEYINLEYTILSYHIFHAGKHERGRKSGNNLFTKTKRIWFSEKCRILYDTIKQCYDKNNYEYMNITHTFMELYPNKEQLLTDVLISNDLQTNVNIDIYYEKLQKLYLLSLQRQIAIRLHHATNNNQLINIHQDNGIYNISQFLQQSKDNTLNLDKNIIEWIGYYKDNQKNTTQYELGIDFLDEALQGGIEPYQLVLINGDADSGKTSLGLQILENLSKNHKTCFFNFEFPNHKYIYRLQKKHQSLLQQEKMTENCSQNIMQNMILIDTTNYDNELSNLANKIEMLYDKGMRFFLIDSQMWIQVEENVKGEEAESKKFEVLANLANRLEIVIFLITQTSKLDSINPFGSKKGGYYSSIIINIKQNKNNENLDNTKRTIHIHKNKQTGIRNTYNAVFDTTYLTFSKDNADNANTTQRDSKKYYCNSQNYNKYKPHSNYRNTNATDNNMQENEIKMPIQDQNQRKTLEIIDLSVLENLSDTPINKNNNDSLIFKF